MTNTTKTPAPKTSKICARCSRPAPNSGTAAGVTYHMSCNAHGVTRPEMPAWNGGAR